MSTATRRRGPLTGVVVVSVVVGVSRGRLGRHRLRGRRRRRRRVAADRDRDRRARLGGLARPRGLREHDAVLGRVGRVDDLDEHLEARSCAASRSRRRGVKLVTSGTAATFGPFETNSVTVVPGATTLFALGSCWTTTPFGSFDSTSRRATANPAPWSVEAADSYGEPTTGGIGTGFGPCETLIRTSSPLTRRVPAFGSWPVTVPGLLVGVHVADVRLQPLGGQGRDRVGRLLADHPRHRHLRLAGRDLDHDEVALLGALARRPGLLEDPADVHRVVRQPPHLDLEPGGLELLHRQPLDRALDERHRDRLRLVQLVLDLRVDVPPSRHRRDHEQRGEQPRPDRPAAHRLVVLVEAGRRPVRRRRHRRHHVHRPLDDLRRRRGDRRHDARAAEHLRRHLLRLGRDRLAAGDAGEVDVHLLGRLVPVLGPLRERAQDDRVELVRHLGPLRRRRLAGSPTGASSRSRAACRRRTAPTRSASRRGRSRPSRCRTPATSARPSPARGRGTAPCR